MTLHFSAEKELKPCRIKKQNKSIVFFFMIIILLPEQDLRKLLKIALDAGENQYRFKN